MAGRAAQTKPKKRVGWPTPLKKGRTCDVQPAFFGFSVQHSRWFKQLRRLQHLAHWSHSFHSAAPSVSGWLHGLSLWNSVLTATGFPCGFAAWWVGTFGWTLPLTPPSPDGAAWIYQTFLPEVRALERSLNQVRQQARAQARILNPNLIFQDVKRPFAKPVDSLLHRVAATVVSLDSTDQTVVLDSPCAFSPDQPIFVGGKTISVIHADHDTIWTDNIESFRVGDRVCQTTPLGKLDLIFDAFHTQWKQRWCRHDQVPFDRWQTLVDFSARVLPFRPHPHLELTVPLLRAEAKRKKPHSATGLDGVSRADVLTASDSVLGSLLSAYTRAETDGAWPEQMLAGKVTSLAKKPCPWYLVYSFAFGHFILASSN